MTKVPDFTPEKWEKWLKDKAYAEERVEHLEDELDKALDEQDRLSRSAEDLRSERDSEKRLRLQAENDARRAKAAADQAAAAAAAASRSLKIGEKQLGGAKDGEVQELRVEIQQLKAKNHGLNTQLDSLAAEHQGLADLLSAAKKDKTSLEEEARGLRESITVLVKEKDAINAEEEAKKAEREALLASADAAKAEAAALDAQNHRLGDELDRLAGKSWKKKSGGGADPAELAAAVKARMEAEEHAAMVETQLSEVQSELRDVREELAALQEEATLKAGAAREGIAAADAQTAALTEELNALRVEMAALREKERSSSTALSQSQPTPSQKKELEALRTELGTRKAELEALRQSASVHKGELEALRQQATEAGALRKEAEAKAAASDARAAELHAELSDAQRAKASAVANLDVDANGKDEDGMMAQLMETMTLLKDAESAKRMAQDDLASKNQRIDELERQMLAAGEREAHEANGDDSAASNMVAMQEELADLHEMLNNVSSERDAALSELRRAAEAGGGPGNASSRGAGGGDDNGHDEAGRLQEECNRLRDQIQSLEHDEQLHDQGEGNALTGPKRVKSLEDQVQRLAEEHTRQNENWREVSGQMEKDKEELSQELIAAKLQVAQLYMEVDGIKLRHRQAALAATAAALEIQDEASELSPVSSARTSPPPSPNSPITMNL